MNQPSVGPSARNNARPAPPADNRPSVDASVIQQNLRAEYSRQPHDIKVPESIDAYRSNMPYWSYETSKDLWHESKRHKDSKRWFWRNYCSRAPRISVIYSPSYYTYPYYAYYPGFHYWGYDDCWYDYTLGTRVVVVYSPTITRYETQTEYVYTEDPEFTYSAGGTKDPWPDYRREREEVEDAAGAIELAWEHGKVEDMASMVDSDLPVRLYESGEYLYWVGQRQFLDRIAADMEDSGTVKFTVDKIVPVRPGEALFYAHHELEESGRLSGTRYERYSLERISGRWVISAFETSFSPMIDL